MLVAIALGSSCHAAMLGAEEFAVNVLGERHRPVAQRFATHGVDRFAAGGFGEWEGGVALPYLPDAKALLRCRTVDVIRAGDHDLILGTPLEIRNRDVGTSPLLW
ncbi:flavin reductase family protein [Kitasatospora sp. NPDC091335]|uniref:flavin reductase family protein n=1 Tax=Kitasatospora sp. NPDC091335 TaxID=3364085 RepID=UPI0037F3AC3F